MGRRWNWGLRHLGLWSSGLGFQNGSLKWAIDRSGNDRGTRASSGTVEDKNARRNFVDDCGCFLGLRSSTFGGGRGSFVLGDLGDGGGGSLPFTLGCGRRGGGGGGGGVLVIALSSCENHDVGVLLVSRSMRVCRQRMQCTLLKRNLSDLLMVDVVENKTFATRGKIQSRGRGGKNLYVIQKFRSERVPPYNP